MTRVTAEDARDAVLVGELRAATGEPASGLRGGGGFVSGEALAEKLGVTRTVVWMAMGRLKSRGYAIESRTRAGYRLASVPDSLAWPEVEPYLGELGLAAYECLGAVGSTNDYAKKLASSGGLAGLDGPAVIVAERQTSGKGRLGRSWTSPPGKSVIASILLRPKADACAIGPVTLVAACSAARAIREVCGLDMMVKWPNDIVRDGKKAVGILAEMSGHLERIDSLVVGVGMNANLKKSDFSPELSDRATSLMELVRAPVDRKALLGCLVKDFLEDFDEFLRNGFDPGTRLHRFYCERCVNIGRQVTFGMPGEPEKRGIGRAVTGKGALVVGLDGGGEAELVSGEASVRGADGYV